MVKTYSILLADDEPLILENEIEIIEEALPACEIHAFSDGIQLLQYAKEHRADIAFLDIDLPEINGMDTAAELKKIQPRINIIFLTGCDGYYREAMNLHASGYLLKPVCEEDIIKEINELRYETAEKTHKLVKVQCKGSFDVWTSSNEHINFSRNKSKEAFAYLVYLQGSSCTNREMAAILFEDAPFDSSKQNYIRKIISSMRETLRNYGVEDVINKGFNNMSLNMDLVELDYKKDGEPVKKPLKFMEQYSWAEFF